MSDTPTLPAPLHPRTPRDRGDAGRSGTTEIGRSLPEWSVSPTASDRAALPPGTLVHGKYIVGELLGHGGSGTVHRAHAPSIRREAALKVQSDASSLDPAMRRRFLREMRLLASIDHPGVVKVFEMGRLPDGHLVAALELIEGSSLRDVLRVQHALAPVRAVEIAAQLCSALAAVHERDVLHRDLKPGNVIVLSDRRGTRVKLIDFGIASSMTGDAAPITTPAEVVGTPGYLSPERTVLGVPVDGRSDLFGLGVVLYEMLVGERPFGSSGGSLARGLAAGPERLRATLGARVSVELTALALALLAGEPNDRPASAAETLERLASVPEAEGIELAPASTPPEAGTDPLPRVMVVATALRQRDAWSRAVRSAGASPIPLASAETARMLLRHETAPGRTYVLLSSTEEHDLRGVDAERLAGIICVAPARLEGADVPRPSDARIHHIAMPVTEADLRAVLER